MLAAAGKAPPAVDDIAAVDDDRFGARGRAPGDGTVGSGKNLARDFWVEIARRLRARHLLRQAPGGRGVGGGDGLDHLVEGNHIGRAAAERSRQQHAEQAGLVQRRDDLRHDAPLGLDAVARGLDHRHQRRGARDPIDRRVSIIPREHGVPPLGLVPVYIRSRCLSARGRGGRPLARGWRLP